MAVLRMLPEEDIFTCWASAPSTGIIIKSTENQTDNTVKAFGIADLPKGSVKLGIKYSILVEQQALTREAYNYWKDIVETSENLGGLFDPLPWQVKGNIRCVSHPEEIVVGYFGGGSTSSRRYFLTPGDVPLAMTYIPVFRCRTDTISLEDIAAFKGPIISGVYDLISGDLLGYSTGSLVDRDSPYYACVDCRASGGVTSEPDFWE